MENEKKKGKGSVVVIIILLLIIIGLCGFICYDKFLSNNSKVDTEVDNKESKKEVEKEEEEKETDTDKKEIAEEATAEDTNGYVEKVYSWSENNTTRTIVLFKSGSCVRISNYEATANCTYKIDNNKIILSSTKTGPNRGDLYTYTYTKTIDENNEEYIKNDEDQNEILKSLK